MPSLKDVRRPTAFVPLLIVFQALESGFRAMALGVERQADIDIYHHDPFVDIVANYAIGTASLLAAFAMVFIQRIWVWWSVLAVMVIGTLDALHLVIADYGGTSYVVLFLVRGLLIIVLSLAEVRDQFT